MEGLVKAVGKATAPWWSSTSYEDELDATDAAWVRNGKSDSLDSSEACSPRRRSFGDGPRPIPPLDEDPRGRKPSYEEEVKDASPKKKRDQWTCPQCTFLNVENHGKCGVCGSARPRPPPPPEMPSSFRKAKLGRGSGISLSPDAKRLAALLNVDADTVVVVKPGYEPPPQKEGLDDAEDDATTATTRVEMNQWWGARNLMSTQVTDPRPKSSPSVDGANEQEAYGVAVSLLVAGLRPDDLEQRLQSEGWSPEISAKVSRDLGKLGAGLSRHNKPEAPASKPSPDALNAMLAKRQPQVKKEAPDPLAAYLKMKKFGVAAEGVLARMQMDGCSEALKQRFRKLHKLEPTESVAPERAVTSPTSPAEPQRATIALHWEKMDSHAKKSVWNGGDTFAELDGELDAEDLTDLKDIFSAKASTAPVRRKSPPSIMRASPLDAKRAQNATIALAIASRKFRGDFDRVWRAVAECAAALPIDALERLQEVLPTKKETESVIQWFHAERAARPNVAAYNLGSPAERFILATSRVPRHQEYLQAAKLRASFQERYDKIDEGSRVAIDAAQSLVQSRGLTLVLQRILAVGNAMNAGTSIGDARGIRLGSLLAIVKTKGRDRQTSVLDYVVQGLLKRGHARVLTEVVVSLKTKVANASRVPIEDFRNEARRLKAGLATVQKLRAEADSDLRKEENDSLSRERSLMGARDPCRRRRKWASSGSQMSIARASAHASAGRRVARLGSFCDQSRRSLDALDRRRLAPMALKLRAVCEYFGEPVADDAAAPAKASYVFTTVGAFLRALDGAVAQASRVARREASLQKSLAVTRRASSGDVEVERGERDNRPRRRAHSAVLT